MAKWLKTVQKAGIGEPQFSTKIATPLATYVARHSFATVLRQKGKAKAVVSQVDVSEEGIGWITLQHAPEDLQGGSSIRPLSVNVR